MSEIDRICAYRIMIIATLVVISGASTSCGITPISPSETSSATVVTASRPMTSTPMGMRTVTATPTKQPTASPTETPFTTTIHVPAQVTATQTPTSVGQGDIIYFEVSSGIWKVDPADGANKELLYTDDLCKDLPRLSPDGWWIAYYASECGQLDSGSLWLLDIRQKVAWPVNAPVRQVDANWLPDNKLLYTEYPSFVFDPYGDAPPDFGTDYRTFVYDPVRKTPKQIPALPFLMTYRVYAISPTEERIAAVKEGEQDLLVSNFSGGQAKELIKDYSMHTFVWSPDGKSLAYDQGGRRQEIFVIDVDSGRVHQVTHRGEERSIILRSWSPDGKWIAFDQNWQICVVAVQDGEEKCFDIRPPGLMEYPIAWSPDSSTIVQTHRSSQGDTWDLYLIRLVDGTITRLTYDENYEYYVLWRQ